MRDLRSAVGGGYGDLSVVISCPSPDHEDSSPSCSVYHDHMFCHGCRRWWSFGEALANFGKTEADLAEVSPVLREKMVDVPPASLVRAWHETLVDRRSPLSHRITYLHERGLHWSTIRDHQLGHTGRYFTIPVFNEGVLMNVKRRRDDTLTDEDAPKYLNSRHAAPMAFRPAKGAGPVAICEGEFDALLLSQYGVDAITSTHGAGSLPKVVAGLRAPVIYVLTDQDHAGEEAANAINPVVKGRVVRVRFGAKDVTDALWGKSGYERLELLRRWFAQ
jgi:hypothetical protein